MVGKHTTRILRLMYATIVVLLLCVIAYITLGPAPHNSALVFVTAETSVVDPPRVSVVAGNDLLGKAELSYAGGTEGRNKNIEIGIKHIDGMILKPGEEFSFKKAIGVVTAEEGYSEEKIFLNGEVTKGVGGGLCQLSSTLFRSVLDAGLQVTERHNHSYTVSRYDVGLDATYADPGPDFKFRNDLADPIRIVGKTENQKVIFELFGTKDGRVASTTEPEILSVIDFPPTKYLATSTKFAQGQECFNTPQIGYVAKIVYSIVYRDGATRQQDFISKYKPLQRVCYISI